MGEVRVGRTGASLALRGWLAMTWFLLDETWNDRRGVDDDGVDVDGAGSRGRGRG